ncbi:MAG: methyltransferase dimerization domain-containing protein [Paludibaculum sp.]
MQPGIAMDPAPNPGLIFENLNAHQRSAALRTAIELDLFRAVGQGPADALTLAARCSASPRGIRILCDFLVIMGLLQKSDGIYSHTSTSALFLDPNSPSSLHSTARFLGLAEMKASYDNLTEVVRTGRTSLPGEGTVEPDNPVWVEFAHSMAPMMGPLAGPLGTVVLEGRTGPLRILDIAAGHGLFGIEIAKKHLKRTSSPATGPRYWMWLKRMRGRRTSRTGSSGCRAARLRSTLAGRTMPSC